VFIDGGTSHNGPDMDAVDVVNFGDGVRMIKPSGVGGSAAITIVRPKIGRGG
jgi:hypothetical protein